MADTRYFEDILGVVDQLESREDYPEFVECIIDNTKDNDIKAVEADGSYSVIYHGIQLNTIDDLRKYFTLQPLIDEKYFEQIKQIMDEVDYQYQFVERVNRLCGEDSVRLYDSVLVIENDHLVSRNDVLNKLTSPANLEPIKRLCTSFEMSHDERAIICDGVAVIALSKSDLVNLGEHGLPIEGYLGSNNSVTWTKIDKGTFVRKTAGDISLLYTIDNPRDFEFLREKDNSSGVITRPYPIGKYDNGDYCYWFRKI